MHTASLATPLNTHIRWNVHHNAATTDYIEIVGSIIFQGKKNIKGQKYLKFVSEKNAEEKVIERGK